jgi:hypothetical protein
MSPEDKAKIESLQSILDARRRKQEEHQAFLWDQKFRSIARRVQEGQRYAPCDCERCLLAIVNLDSSLICRDWVHLAH